MAASINSTSERPSIGLGLGDTSDPLRKSSSASRIYNFYRRSAAHVFAEHDKLSERSGLQGNHG